ncbi:helix-turn-helix transcriptional regulator [Staphylococcus sp. 47.1]|uniref:helix-turn-helix domain-containing protein n=1 Tax=Staphylococcus sp. 47.1 TaxID=1929484 RepID=UPI00094706C5|nr:helix-turn-helix transcriptional regulator [Staphylococcus sp. 47.1]OLF32244.1 transcriptional regulator [Staphylococcus sp. 47.1]
MKNNLSMYMGKYRITATKLSEETGLARSVIHELYHEKQKNPNVISVMKICDYLGITLNDFFDIEKD